MKLKTLVAVMAGALALTLGQTPDGSLGWAAVAAQEKVSAEVGKHLQAVQGLLKGGKFREALAKLKDAEAVPNRNAGENAVIEQMRFAGAQGAGEPDTMVRAFEALKGAGRLSGPQNLQYLEAIAGTYSRLNQHPKALQWSNRYFAEGGNSATMKQVQTAAQYYSGDMGAIIKATSAEIAATEKAGGVPARDKLELLMSAASRAKDSATETQAAEKLLTYYPSKERWADVISRVQSNKNFSSRFQLDMLRLRLATGNMRGEADYMELAQLAGGNGFPDEGMKAVEAGFAAGVLGQGGDAARHERLKKFMAQKVADAKSAFPAAEAAARDTRDGNGLIPLGLQLAQRGEAAKGVAMIEAGIAKGNLKREDDAKLYLGMAQFLAGETAKAQATWRGVRGSDGSGDIARLWSVYARQSKK
ncbi:MAG: hypothetical protein O9335_15235 [Inhella sp.]|uniref:hypothetical protein n=1 Tax=Inhella sp. TaxID=1921806 RepID=UPI0022C0E5F5|nr:hypothetical protein [Inhella sp.]MCZ8236505.1 hypothetical protein [Inhella sp.]